MRRLLDGKRAAPVQHRGHHDVESAVNRRMKNRIAAQVIYSK